MEDEVTTKQERIANALEELRELGIAPSRGDGFDIGGGGGKYQGPVPSRDVLTEIIENPERLAEQLSLSHAQAQNIKSLMVSGGTGAIHRILAKYLGDEVASTLGGLVSGYLARRLIGR